MRQHWLPTKKLRSYTALLIALAPVSATADLTDLTFANELERRSAAANQQTYNRLLASGCDDYQSVASETCDGSTFQVWQEVRELVHTANALDPSSEAPQAYNLGLDLEDLGFALRWTAAEELASQGSLSSSFVGGQISGLSARIAALRLGARGFAVTHTGTGNVASFDRQVRGGGASADDGWVRWGGYLNAGFSTGDKDATVLEDAFDYDGHTLNGGLDYRINENWVVGSTLGYQDMTLDFDASQSVVDGSVDMAGLSLMPFGLYQSETWFGSASIGYQQLTFDTVRSIRYPSLNPLIPSTDTQAISDNDATVWSFFSTIGYTVGLLPQLNLEPYFSLDLRQIDVDKFTERDINDSGLNLVVDSQSISSYEGIGGLKLQYVLTPSYAVLVPFFDAQWHHEFEDEENSISASYAGAIATAGDAAFVIPTDIPDADYQIYTVGLSSVLSGASQTEVGGAAGGALQAYFNYRTILGMENYTHNSFTLGVRYEF